MAERIINIGGALERGESLLAWGIFCINLQQIALRVIYRVFHFPIATSVTALGMRLLISLERERSCKGTDWGEINGENRLGWIKILSILFHHFISRSVREVSACAYACPCFSIHWIWCTYRSVAMVTVSDSCYVVLLREIYDNNG